jgi:cation transport ATPase
MICRFCGKEIEEGSVICNHCAKPVIKEDTIKATSNNQEQANNEKQKPKKNYDYLINSILVVCFAIGYFLRSEYSTVSYVLMSIGIIGVIRMIVSASPKTTAKPIEDRVLTPEEEQQKIKMQEELEKKREISNLKSIKNAKISLYLNGFVIMMISVLAIFYYAGFILRPIDYLNFSIIVAIVYLIGIGYSVMAVDKYNKNKISKVAGSISLGIFIVVTGTIAIMAFIWVVDCFRGCPG